MEMFSNATAIIALISLIVMEIILGMDNLIFVSIIAIMWMVTEMRIRTNNLSY
ncbi:MAG: hypothetical protein V7750_13795 [Sneathiella sp.]